MRDEVKTGRPSSFTSELGERICVAVERLGFLSVASELNGVGRATVARWRAAGERGESPELERFATDLAKARARFAERQLERLDGERPEWLLERLDRETFSPPKRHELSGPEGKPLEVEPPRVLSAETIAQIKERILYGAPAAKPLPSGDKGDGG